MAFWSFVPCLCGGCGGFLCLEECQWWREDEWVRRASERERERASALHLRHLRSSTDASSRTHFVPWLHHCPLEGPPGAPDVEPPAAAEHANKKVDSRAPRPFLPRRSPPLGDKEGGRNSSSLLLLSAVPLEDQERRRRRQSEGLWVAEGFSSSSSSFSCFPLSSFSFSSSSSSSSSLVTEE